MTIRLQIKCINKSERYNPYERILRVGVTNSDGTRWRLSQTEAIVAIENRKYEFFVVEGRYEVKVIIAISAHGHKYLKTEADGHGENNLLSLPECP